MYRTTSGLIFLAAAISSPGLQAAGPAMAMCRGDYPMLLMTEQECRQYSRQMKSLRAKGQSQGLASLQRQHAELLHERAAACLCIENVPGTMSTQQLALTEPDC